MQAPRSELSRCPPGSYRAVQRLCLPVLVTSVQADTDSFCGQRQVGGGAGTELTGFGECTGSLWWLRSLEADNYIWSLLVLCSFFDKVRRA